MAKSRRDLQREFAAELYCSASFFKMSSVGSPDVDAKINRDAGASRPMANPYATQRYFPEREKMPKFPKGK